MKHKNKKRNIFLRIFDIQYLFYDFVKLTGIIPILIFLRLKINYLEEKKEKGLFKGPAIIISNHTGTFDIIVILSLFWNRRISFVAKKDLFKKKIGNFFFKGVKAISLDNENVSLDVIKKAENAIYRGHLVGIFPEGHINLKNEMDEFKSGAVLLSIITGAPIIPVYIKKKTKWWEHQQIAVGKKIDISKYLSSLYPTVNEMEQISTLLKQEELKLSKLLKN